MDVSHNLEDQGNPGQPNHEANIDSSTNHNISMPMISLPPMTPSLPMTPLLPTNALPPTSLLPPTGPLLPLTQTCQPTTHTSGHPICSVQQLQTTLHKCCNMDITEEEIANGSTIVCCLRQGCEMVWVSYIQPYPKLEY